MIDSLITSTQINLSDQAIEEIAFEVIGVAQQLGLSVNCNVLPYIEQTDVFELIQQFNSFGLPPFPLPAQTWGA